MTNSQLTPGVVAGRLSADEYSANFADLHPPLDAHEAAVAADRCYFCHDAPCIDACPTGIDIPMFIRQIAVGMPEEAARTIFDQNILGGMCARVCPTETLCEEACVREAAEGRPVEIGRLQRHATDALMAKETHPFERAEPTGKRIAVVGAGPAGLACAHRLAMKGHEVALYDARPKPGGLNEFGIASYKTPGGFAQAEIEWLLRIGGISLETGRALGRDLALDSLVEEFDAVFLGIGLAGANALNAPGENMEQVRDAVEFIAELRQCEDPAGLPVGRNVVVVGGGMTAVDAAVQAKLLGAENVSIVYRRGPERMSASAWERDLAASKGGRMLTGAQPRAAIGNGSVREVEFEYAEDTPEGLRGTGETFRLPADQVLLAIGQKLESAPVGLALEGGKIRIDGAGRTSMPSVWAGGDCASGGDDLTVTAVAEGRDAAEDINASLMGGRDVGKDDACPAWERDALACIRDMVDEKNLRAMFVEARKRGSRALEEAAHEKLCSVRIGEATDAETGTVERDVWRSVVETEELLREKQGRTVFLRGTRQMINGHGATNTVYKIVRKMNPSIMFGNLIEFGRPDLLFEAIALRHLDDFDSDTRDIARNRLVVHGIDPEDVARK